MLWPLRIFFFYVAAPPLLLAYLLYFAIDNKALSPDAPRLNSWDIQRAKYILRNPTDNNNATKTIALNERDLNIACNYLLNHLVNSSSRITLNKNSLGFVITLHLPANLFGHYLNITFNLQKTYGYPSINSLRIGQWDIADEFAGLIIESIIKYSPLKHYYILASQHIRHIEIKPKRLSISYLSSFQEAASSASLRENKSYQTIIFYQQLIKQIVLEHNSRMRLSLAEIMQPLFLAAYQRSSEADAIEENRAVILAVSSYVNKRELNAYLPIKFNTPKPYHVFLYRRIDMAKHFVGSAALAATGASTLAHMLGQEKELLDSKQRGGSGFSFIDLASDRAGLKFGQYATHSPRKARELQKAMHDINDYRAFMPDVRDLPEQMPNHVFKKRYGSIYSTRYQSMLQIIDQRISSLPIYR